uniref:F-box domain-containing protein n=2 Tax=Moniliophthora roreri TaxID=221103 RepID=A0A0W0G4F3_MONRR
MPPEILTPVFEYCVQADTSGHALSGLAMPWVISQICRGWRVISLSTPSLWQIIRLDTRKLDHRTSPSSLNLLRAWLERSQPLPIACLGIFPDAVGATNAEYLDLFILHSKRWRAVEFCLGTQNDLYRRIVNINLHLPFLQSFAVEVTVLSDSEDVRGMVPSWIAPNLREVVLFTQYESQRNGSLLTLPWSQLVELDWSPSTTKVFLDVSPALVSLLQHFTLPQLRRLDMSGSYQSIVAIMHRLCLPSLQRLDVDTDEQIGAVADQLLSSVARLQLRSSCNLYSLAAPFTLFSSPNSPSLAEKLGTVQDVRLLSTEEDNVRAISNFLHSTMFRDLNTLHLLFRELPDKDPALFLDMVQVVTARSHQQPLPYGASRLERLALDVIRPWVLPQIHISAQLEPFQTILRLQSDGLVLLGKVVDGKWFSFFGDAHWSDEDLRMSACRWARFGYSDWLHRSEVWRNHLLEVDASRTGLLLDLSRVPRSRHR